MRSGRSGVLMVLLVSICGSWLTSSAADYEDVVVTYADGSEEVYRFAECINWKARWELAFPFVGVMGWVIWDNASGSGDLNDPFRIGHWLIARLDCDPADCPNLRAYSVATSPSTRADDLSNVTWGLYSHPSGTPVDVSGGDFLSGTRCCGPCDAPSLSGVPLTPYVGAAYSFTPTLVGGCGPVEYSIQNRPYWATFDSDTGTLSGTPDCAARAAYAGIVVTATDANLDSADLSFSIIVTDHAAIANCPDSILLVRPKDGGPAIATWGEPTASSACGILSFTSDHASGDTFPLGTTSVTYTAAGVDDVTMCSFDVTVVLNPADINQDGVVNVLDARLCLQMAVGVLVGTPYERGAADVDGDGDVDMDDATILAEYVIGIIGALP